MVDSHKELSYFINTLKKSKLVQSSISKTGFMTYEMIIPFTRYIEYHKLPLETIYQYDRYADEIKKIYMDYVYNDNVRRKINLTCLDIYCCLMFEFLHYQSTPDEVYEKIKELKQSKFGKTNRVNELLEPFNINFNKTNKTLSELCYKNLSLFLTAYDMEVNISVYSTPELLFRSRENEKKRLKLGGALLFDLLPLFSLKDDKIVENICYLETHTEHRPYLGCIRMSTFLKYCYKYLGIDVKSTFSEDEINWYKECIPLWYFNPNTFELPYLEECNSKEEVKNALELLKEYHHYCYVVVEKYKPSLSLPDNSQIPLTLKNLEYAVTEWSLQKINI